MWLRGTQENTSEQASVKDFVGAEMRLWKLHCLLNSSTYKKKTEACTKGQFLQALDVLAEEHEIFQKTMKKVETEEGDKLFAVAYEAMEELDLAQKD